MWTLRWTPMKGVILAAESSVTRLYAHQHALVEEAGLGRSDRGHGLWAGAGAGGRTRHFLCVLGKSLRPSAPQLSFCVTASDQGPLDRVSKAFSGITYGDYSRQWHPRGQCSEGDHRRIFRGLLGGRKARLPCVCVCVCFHSREPFLLMNLKCYSTPV